MPTITLKRILEASFDEMLDLQFSEKENFENGFVYSYCLYLVNYHEGKSQDREARDNLKSFVELESQGLYSVLTDCREAIRSRQISEEVLLPLESHLTEEDILTAEVSSVLALGHSRLENLQTASIHFKKASELFEKEEMPKKSLISLHNHIFCEAWVKPQENSIRRFLFVIEKARQLEDARNEGLAHMNLSNEYLKAKLWDKALEHANHSVSMMEKSRGSFNDYMTRLNRSLCHLKVGDKKSCLADLEDCRMAPFAEAQEVIKVLGVLTGTAQEEPNHIILPLPWRHWAKQTPRHKEVTLGDLERKVLQIILSGAPERSEVIEKVYDTSADYESLENRFRVLLSRIRKKIPCEILSEDGRLRFADPEQIRHLLQQTER